MLVHRKLRRTLAADFWSSNLRTIRTIFPVSYMATDMEKARVTELHVRMDCNGCVQRIKKAMHSIDGVYDIYLDLPRQKLTVVGRADPETLVKAIRKARKVATISSHTEPGAASNPPPPSEPEAASNPPAAHAADQLPSEATPGEAAPPADPSKDAPPQENPTPEEAKPSSEPQGGNPSESKDAKQVHVVHLYPHSHVMGHQNHHEAPYYVSHSYNTHRPSPYVSGYEYLLSPPQDMRYNIVDAYGDGHYQNRVNEAYGDGYYKNQRTEGYYQNQGNEGYYQNHGSDGNQITSMFSDDNPNACSIM